MIAKPSKKSREDTQPSSTTYLQSFREVFTHIYGAIAYSRRSGMTTGPPPNIIVPISDISASVQIAE